MTEAAESVADIAEKLRADLISAAQQSKLLDRQSEIVKQVMTMSMVGTADEVSQEIGMFQFLRGKHEAFQELMDDHKEAAEQLAANNANSNIAGN